ncbi:MAG: class I SAM-dependent methyltransferase [Leptolyngbya sp.]|nr:class I SAM-dependent methyltransferase [Leptolyngbya sp.]
MVMSLDKVTFFDRWASSYDCWVPSVFYQAVHQRLLTTVTLPAQAQVLELGCGTGKLLQRLAAAYPDCRGMGLDFSPRMVAMAQTRNRYGDRLSFRQGSVDQIPAAPHSYDGIFCSISFLHYPDPVAVLAEVRRVLKPTGQFYLADYRPPPWQPEDTTARPITPGGVRFYNAEARERLAAAAGLRCDRHVYLLGPVLGTVFSPWVSPES